MKDMLNQSYYYTVVDVIKHHNKFQSDMPSHIREMAWKVI